MYVSILNFCTQIWTNDVIMEKLLQQIPQERLPCLLPVLGHDITIITAISRLGEPSDCAGAVSFLCSDAASYITGETIVISGGMQSRL